MKKPAAALLIAVFVLTILSVSTPSAATPTDVHYLVLNDPACTPTAIATDAGCWSHTSGGPGGAGIPGIGNGVKLDSLSGAGTGVLDADLSVAEWCASSDCGGTNYLGAIDTGGFGLRVNGDFWNGGTFIDNTFSTVTVVGGDFISTVGTFDGQTNDGTVEIDGIAGETIINPATAVFAVMDLIGVTPHTTDSSFRMLDDFVGLRLYTQDAVLNMGTFDMILEDNGFTGGQFGLIDAILLMDGIQVPASVRPTFGTISPNDLSLVMLVSYSDTDVIFDIVTTDAGSLTFFELWLRPNTLYNLFRDNVLVTSQTSESTGRLVFNIDDGMWGTADRIEIKT